MASFRRPLHIAATLLAAAAVSSTASAQDITYTQSGAGAPQPGVDVQYRYSNPSDSQRVLDAPPASSDSGAASGGVQRSGSNNPYQTIIESRAPTGPDGQPVDVRNPFSTESVTSVGTASYAFGQLVPAESLYRGVIPNTQNTLPHVAAWQRRGASAGASNTLTWIGYQPFADFSRIFLQTGRAAQYQVMPSPDGRRVTIRIQNTQISLRNFTREMVAANFGRAVSNIDARRGPDGSTEVIIDLQDDADYTFEQGTSSDSGVTYYYLYMNFNDAD